MTAGWISRGYQPVKNRWGTYAEALRFKTMTGMVPARVPKMRRLARLLRGQAEETNIALYQRKLATLASELEEAAEEAETREDFLKTYRLVS